MTTLTTERIESVIDEVMAAANDEIYKTIASITRVAESLQYANRTPRIRVGRSYGWAISTDQVIEAMTTKLDDGTITGYNADVYRREIQRIAEYRAQINELSAYIYDLDEVYDAGPWSRFFLVAGGHIHSSTNCHSCYDTTRFAWLPALSGLTEADAVAEHGSILCTHCYPTAPVEWTVSKQGEKPADYYCEGSGKVPTVEEYTSADRNGNPRPAHRYRCTGCNMIVSYNQVTTRGFVRKHKK